MKRIRSNLYTCTANKNGYLYAKDKYPTKIKPSDLPEWFVYGRYYKFNGYMCSKGVVDLKYVPSKNTNHFLKDDYLMVSYSEKITPIPNSEAAYEKYCGYDERIYGASILPFLKAARKYSGYDISGIIKQLEEKTVWLSKEYPSEFGDFKFDAAEYFAEG